jgi:hypothetical protein
MEDRHQRLEEHGDAFHPQAYPEPLSGSMFGEPILWVNTARYPGMTLRIELLHTSCGSKHCRQLL